MRCRLVVVGHDAGAGIQRNLREDFGRDAVGINVVLLVAERALDNRIVLRGGAVVLDEGHVSRMAYLQGGRTRLLNETVALPDLHRVVAADDAGPVGAVFHTYDSHHDNLRPFKG